MSARYSATPAGLCRPRRGNWSRVGVRSAGCAYARAVLIRVLPYDPRWPVRFEHERAELEGLLAPWLSAGVHHIGSTSVPGLARIFRPAVGGHRSTTRWVAGGAIVASGYDGSPRGRWGWAPVPRSGVVRGSSGRVGATSAG